MNNCTKKTKPKENHEFLIAKTTISKIKKSERYKKMEESEFEFWFEDVKNLVNDYSYAQLTSIAHSQEHATKYKYIIGYAYLHKLVHREREEEELGKLGNIVFDRNTESIFKKIDLTTKDVRRLTGMIFISHKSAPNRYLKDLNAKGAIQVGTENCKLGDRATNGAINYVAENRLTFACNDSSKCYTAQWLAIEKNLCTFTAFLKRWWRKDRAFTITARHLADLSLIARRFPFNYYTEPEDRNPTVFVYFPSDSEEMDNKLRRLIDIFENESPHFPGVKHVTGQKDMGEPWRKDLRQEMKEEHHFIIAPCGRVKPNKKVFATSITAPVYLRNQTTNELMKHHIEIISHRCRYNLFDFATQVFTFLKSENPEERRLLQNDDSTLNLQTQNDAKREEKYSKWKTNREDLSRISTMDGIASSEKYKEMMDVIECMDWFQQVFDHVSNNSYLASRDFIKDIRCDDGSLYPLRLNAQFISMVCLYKFELKTSKLDYGREKSGQVGTLIFDQDIVTINEKLNRQMQAPLSGMVFIADKDLPESIKQYVTDQGAIQLASENLASFDSRYRSKSFLKIREKTGAAYFVSQKCVHFALNINNGCHSEQFIATKLGIYACTVNINIPDKQFSVIITAFNFSDLKLIASCFLPQPDDFYQPKQKSDLRILYFFGNESKELDDILKLSFETLRKDSNWGCRYDTNFFFQKIRNPDGTRVTQLPIRRDATKPYPDSDRQQMEKGAYDFIIAPPEWVKPSESLTSMFITMPARAYVNEKLVIHHVEVIAQDCYNNPFGFAEIFTALMNSREEHGPDFYASV